MKMKRSHHHFDMQMSYVYDLAILENIRSEAWNYYEDKDLQKGILYPKRSLADANTRKAPLERALSWIARALVGEVTGSVVAVCFTYMTLSRPAAPESKRVGMKMEFSTNRSAQTDNPIDRQNYEADERASQKLVQLLNKLIVECAQSPKSDTLTQKHEDSLLHFLIERSKGRVAKKATDLHEQAQGLGTTLNEFVLPPNTNSPPVRVTNWENSLEKLCRLARPLKDKKRNHSICKKSVPFQNFAHSSYQNRYSMRSCVHACVRSKMEHPICLIHEYDVSITSLRIGRPRILSM